MRLIIAALVLSGSLLSGCASNPVTGKTELQFISEPQEIALGEQNYLPSRQMQGGQYIIEPQLTDYVNQIGQRLAAVSDRPDLPYEFVVLNNSVPNAWALPGGKIAVNRGLLLELNSEAELAAVLGHEIIHAAARHGAKSVERGMLLQGALLALQLSTQDNRYASLIVGGAQVGAMLLSTKYGRNAELESDYYGMRYMSAAGYDPDAAIGLQQTFVRLSKDRSNNLLLGLFASHPPSAQRVAKNRETAAQLPDGGELGQNNYQQAMAGIRANQPAYKKYDEAIKHAQENRTDQASELARQAIALEPREAKFYGLLGDIAAQRKDYGEALRYYNDSINLNPAFFQTYLGRGLAHEATGELRFAEQDLTRSIQLLPTATAHYTLGSIAERSGRTDEARRHYAQASQSESDVGQAATRAFVTLDLPENPDQYIKLRLQLDGQGQVGVVVANQSPFAVNKVDILVGVLDPTGRTIQQTKPFRIERIITPGQSVIIGTGIGPVTDAQQLQRIRTEVRSAELAR